MGNKIIMIVGLFLVAMVNIFLFTLIRGWEDQAETGKRILGIVLAVLLVISDIVLIRKLRKKRRT